MRRADRVPCRCPKASKAWATLARAPDESLAAKGLTGSAISPGVIENFQHTKPIPTAERKSFAGLLATVRVYRAGPHPRALELSRRNRTGPL